MGHKEVIWDEIEKNTVNMVYIHPAIATFASGMLNEYFSHKYRDFFNNKKIIH